MQYGNRIGEYSMKKIFPLPTIALAIFVMVIFGVSDITAEEKSYRIMITLPSFKEPFFVHMQKALNRAGKEHNLVIIEADGEGDSNIQSSHIDRAIAMQVDGIIIGPNDIYALAPAIEDAIDAGIPVVTIDRRVKGVDGIIGHVGADNIALEVAHFYKKIIKLGVSIQNVDTTPKLEDEEEQARADRYMKEWRMFGKGLVRIK